jgi:drug/metabolite transporter (DMT)-like permease
MLGVLFALATVACWAVSDLLIKLCLGGESKWRVLLLSQLCSAAFMLAAALASGEIFGIRVEWLPWLVALSALNFAGVITYYKAMGNRELSLVSPIGNTWAIATIALGVVFYGESVSMLQWAAICMVIGGILAISIKKGQKPTFETALGYAALSSLIWGVFFFILKAPGEAAGAVVTILAVRILTAGMSLPAVIAKGVRILETRFSLLLLVALMAAFDTLGFVAYILAVGEIPVSIAAPIASAVPALSVLLGIIFLGERPSALQAGGIVLTIAGIIILSG